MGGHNRERDTHGWKGFRILMLVQYHEHHDIIAEFDAASGRLAIAPRPEGLRPSNTVGWFAILNGVSVVFYSQAGRLWLRLGDKLFDLDANSSVHWERVSDSTARFEVTDGRSSFVVRYPSVFPRSGIAVDDDPTPFTDDEDWDIGLFIANILGNEERRKIIRERPQR